MTYHKDIQHGRTPRGSLISKTNDRVHLEITNPEDMAIVSQHLQALTMARIPYEQERKEVYSPRDKGYVHALVIEYDDKLGLPFLALSSADEGEEPNITPAEDVSLPEESSNPGSRFDDVELGIHCAKCGNPIIRGAMPYKKISDEYYHEWCLQTPTGTCYPDAWRHVMQHTSESPVLVHGTTVTVSGRLGHAWVEYPDSTVWEPTSQAIFAKDKFYSLVDPIVDDWYTADEAASMLNVGYHGPWTAEERMKHIGR